MSDETTTPVIESLEQRLIKKHVENIKELNNRREQLRSALMSTEDQIKVLNGAIAGLNELVEARKGEVSNG